MTDNAETNNQEESVITGPILDVRDTFGTTKYDIDVAKILYPNHRNWQWIKFGKLDDKQLKFGYCDAQNSRQESISLHMIGQNSTDKEVLLINQHYDTSNKQTNFTINTDNFTANGSRFYFFHTSTNPIMYIGKQGAANKSFYTRWNLSESYVDIGFWSNEHYFNIYTNRTMEINNVNVKLLNNELQILNTDTNARYVPFTIGEAYSSGKSAVIRWDKQTNTLGIGLWGQGEMITLDENGFHINCENNLDNINTIGNVIHITSSTDGDFANNADPVINNANKCVNIMNSVLVYNHDNGNLQVYDNIQASTFTSFCYAYDKFYAVSTAENYLYKSHNGINWERSIKIDTSATDPIATDWVKIISNGNQFMAIFNRMYNVIHVISGSDMENIEVPVTVPYFDACYDNINEVYYAISKDGSKMLTHAASALPNTWVEVDTEYSVTTNTEMHIACVYKDNMTYVVAAGNNSNKILVTTDNGITFTEVTVSGATEGFSDICYNTYDNKFILTPVTQNKLFVSIDGTTWTTVTNANILGDITSIVYGDNKLLILYRNNSQITVYDYTTNTFTLTSPTYSEPPTSTHGWNNVEYVNNKFIATCNNDEIMVYDTANNHVVINGTDASQYVTRNELQHYITRPDSFNIVENEDENMVSIDTGDSRTLALNDTVFITNTNAREVGAETGKTVYVDGELTCEGNIDAPNIRNMRVWIDQAAPATHNHDSTYASISHNHDGTYAPISHTHTLSNITDWDDVYANLAKLDSDNTFTVGMIINYEPNDNTILTRQILKLLSSDMENDAENSVEVVLGKSETNGNAALLKYAYTNDGDGANYFAITHYGNTSDTYKFYNTHAEFTTSLTVPSITAETINGIEVNTLSQLSEMVPDSVGSNTIQTLAFYNFNWSGNHSIYNMAFGDHILYLIYENEALITLDNKTMTHESTDVNDGTGHKVCITYGRNCCVSLKQNNYICYKYNNETSWHNTPYTYNANYLPICYGNNIFMTVNKSTGDVLYANISDLETWTTVPAAVNVTGNNWCSICFGNNMFVMISDNSNSIASSFDGLTWTVHDDIISAQDPIQLYKKIIYGSNRFIVLPAVGGSKILYSDINNYTVWHTCDINNAIEYYDICFGITCGALLPRTGTDKLLLLVFNDDVLETVETNITTGYTNNCICYGDGTFWIGSNSNKIVQYFRLNGELIFNKTIIANNIPADTEFRLINAETDLNDHEKRIKKCELLLPTYDPVPAVRKSSGTGWGYNRNFNRICGGDDIVYFNGSTLIITAKTLNGTVSRVIPNVITTDNRGNIAYGDHYFVELRTNNVITTRYMEEAEIDYSYPYNANNIPVFFGNHMFLTVDKTNGDIFYAYSSNIGTWTILAGAVDVSHGDTWCYGCYGLEMFILIASNSRNIAVSSDGLTWTYYADVLPELESTQVNKKIIYSENRFVIIPANTYKTLLYSNYGTYLDWNYHELPYSVVDISYGMGYYILPPVSSSNKILRMAINNENDTVDECIELMDCGGTILSTFYNNGLFFIGYKSTKSIHYIPCTMGYTYDKTIATPNLTIDNENRLATAEQNITEINSYLDSNTGRIEALEHNVSDLESEVLTVRKITDIADETTWQINEIIPNDHPWWKDITYGAGKFVIIANNDNRIAYTEDLGVTWNIDIISENSESWSTICYDGSKFIALSIDKMVTSEDAITWTTPVTIDTHYYTSMCHIPNSVTIAVATGDNTYTVIDDSGNCTYKTTADYHSWCKTCYGSNGNKECVMVISSDGYYMKIDPSIAASDSTTDDSPIARFTNSSSITWVGLCYSDKLGIFVAISSNGMLAYTSLDTDSWMVGRTNVDHIADVSNICYIHDKFVVTMFTSRFILYSYDLKEWKLAKISDNPMDLRLLYYDANDNIMIISNHDDKSIAKNMITELDIRDEVTENKANINHTHNANDIVVTHEINFDDYVNSISRSISSTKVGHTSEFNFSINDICHGKIGSKDIHILFPKDTYTNKFGYTDNSGLTWDYVIVTESNNNWKDICFDDTKFVAISENHIIITSTDGLTWNNIGNNLTIAVNTLTYSKNNCTYIAANAVSMYYSKNLTEWISMTVPDMSGESIQHIYPTNNKYIVVPNTGYHIAYCSENSTTAPIVRELPIRVSNIEFIDMVYNDNDKNIVIIAYIDNLTNVCIYSDDNTTWLTSFMINNDNTRRKVKKLYLINDNYVCTFEGEANSIIYSKDLIKWTEINIVNYDNSKYFNVFGYDDSHLLFGYFEWITPNIEYKNILYSMDVRKTSKLDKEINENNTKTHTHTIKQEKDINDLYWYNNYNENHYVSNDDSANATVWYITYINKFIIHTSNNIMHSSDGHNWYTVCDNTQFSAKNARKIIDTHEDSTMLCINSDNNIETSNDGGATWTVTDSSANCKDICYDDFNGRIQILKTDGIYNKNGSRVIDLTSFSTVYTYDGICYGKNMYIVYSSNSTNYLYYTNPSIDYINMSKIGDNNSNNGISYIVYNKNANIFIATFVNSHGNIMYSYDGINWNSIHIYDGDLHPVSVKYLENGKFAICLEKTILFSNDGLKWYESTRLSTLMHSFLSLRYPISDICYGNNKYCIVFKNYSDIYYADVYDDVDVSTYVPKSVSNNTGKISSDEYYTWNNNICYYYDNNDTVNAWPNIKDAIVFGDRLFICGYTDTPGTNGQYGYIYIFNIQDNGSYVYDSQYASPVRFKKFAKCKNMLIAFGLGGYDSCCRNITSGTTSFANNVTISCTSSEQSNVPFTDIAASNDTFVLTAINVTEGTYNKVWVGKPVPGTTTITFTSYTTPFTNITYMSLYIKYDGKYFHTYPDLSSNERISTNGMDWSSRNDYNKVYYYADGLYMFDDYNVAKRTDNILNDLTTATHIVPKDYTTYDFNSSNIGTTNLRIFTVYEPLYYKKEVFCFIDQRTPITKICFMDNSLSIKQLPYYPDGIYSKINKVLYDGEKLLFITDNQPNFCYVNKINIPKSITNYKYDNKLFTTNIITGMCASKDRIIAVGQDLEYGVDNLGLVILSKDNGKTWRKLDTYGITTVKSITYDNNHDNFYFLTAYADGTNTITYKINKKNQIQQAQIYTDMTADKIYYNYYGNVICMYNTINWRCKILGETNVYWETTHTYIKDTTTSYWSHFSLTNTENSLTITCENTVGKTTSAVNITTLDSNYPTNGRKFLLIKDDIILILISNSVTIYYGYVPIGQLMTASTPAKIYTYNNSPFEYETILKTFTTPIQTFIVVTNNNDHCYYSANGFNWMQINYPEEYKNDENFEALLSEMNDLNNNIAITYNNNTFFISFPQYGLVTLANIPEQVISPEVINTLQYVYPVGSIYTSMNDVNPRQLFGFGTWNRIKNRFLYCSDIENSGIVGGEKEHVLTQAELPNIQADFPTVDYGAIEGATGVMQNVNNGNNVSFTIGGNTSAHDYRIKMNFGNNQAHNNMPPYVVVYAWERIE